MGKASDGKFIPHTRITKCGRVCKDCLKWKPWKNIITRGSYGYGARCKECFNRGRKSRATRPYKVTPDQLAHVRFKSGGKRKQYQSEYMYLWRYGRTKDDIISLLESQGFKCAICRSTLAARNERSWHTDHCHKTGQVRGVLCNNCNTALGKFKDSPQLLERAAKYLRQEL